MRITYSIIYILLIAALTVCTVLTRRSDRPVKDSVGFLLAALIPPIVGNLMMILSGGRITALIGCYIYFLGIDLSISALVNFANKYCNGVGKGGRSHKPTLMYVLLTADAVQLLLNPFTGHAFDVGEVMSDKTVFYNFVPYFGQTIHRMVDYAVFLCAILIFIIASVTSPRIYRERYNVILFTLVSVGLVQTYQIFSKSDIDRSMIGYGVFGLVIFYLAILYRPLRLLDRMLSNIVSDLSDAFYIFDPDGNCIWANEQGCRLADVSGSNDVKLTERLRQIFGEPKNSGNYGYTFKRTVGSGEDMRFYVLEESRVNDNAGNLNGTYLRVRDVTKEERELQSRDEQIGQISQEAYRDALTGVGSKTVYNKTVLEINNKISEEPVEFAVVMVDMNNLKRINDDFGHKAGDLYIKGCCHLICEVFKHSPVFRIGGDEFAVILRGEDYNDRKQKTEKLRAAFAESFEHEENDPWLRYSAAVGVAEHASDDNSYELVFKRADEAMYEEKKKFKKKYGSYR